MMHFISVAFKLVLGVKAFMAFHIWTFKVFDVVNMAKVIMKVGVSIFESIAKCCIAIFYRTFQFPDDETLFSLIRGEGCTRGSNFRLAISSNFPTCFKGWLAGGPNCCFAICFPTCLLKCNKVESKAQLVA